MILLWFLLGIALIFGIARYNESNKLFWTLLFAYVMGFAGTKMVLQTVNGNEQGNGNLTQVCSTQAPTTSLSMLSYYVTSDLSKATKVVTAQVPVGQGFTPAICESNIALSEVFGRTRDQPLLTLIKPPELCLQKVISTLHDTG